jgi:two-component system NtrC family sensor kinase
MPEGGTLLVKTEVGPEQTVKITFNDTGSGIPKESLDKIFEPFYTTKARGTGLGLAITRQIIEMHHGEIGIESEPGKGTLVSVILPIDQEELI